MEPLTILYSIALTVKIALLVNLLNWDDELIRAEPNKINVKTILDCCSYCGRNTRLKAGLCKQCYYHG
jgi:hypothetical protein